MSDKEYKILSVDTHEDILFDETLPIEHSVNSIKEAFQAIRENNFDIIIINAPLREFSLLKFIKNIIQREPLILVFLILPTHYQPDDMVEYMSDYLFRKPINWKNFGDKIEKHWEEHKLLRECNLIGKSEEIKDTAKMLIKAAPTKLPVLIEGESGTGKELIAKALHRKSAHSEGKFMAVNCGAIPEGVLESELFGHEKGAFTGADERRKGYFELAHKGTIFLDEIGDLPLNIQVKLLRVLEEKKFMRVGGTEEISVDTRFIAATNKKLRHLIKEGSFRKDLYFRISGITIYVPPLRKRLKDLSILTYKFMESISEEHQTDFGGMSSSALRKMAQYHWPGNVRELKNFVENMIIMAGEDKVTLDDVRPYFEEREDFERELPAIPTEEENQRYPKKLVELLKPLHQEILSIKEDISLIKDQLSIHEQQQEAYSDMDEFKRNKILNTLDAVNWDKEKAADELGVSLRTLYRWLKKYNIQT